MFGARRDRHGVAHSHDPFAQMHSHMMEMENMMRGFSDPFDPFFSNRHGGSHRQTQQDRGPRVSIQEVHEDEPIARTQTDGFVEEPDDDVASHARAHAAAPSDSQGRQQRSRRIPVQPGAEQAEASRRWGSASPFFGDPFASMFGSMMMPQLSSMPSSGASYYSSSTSYRSYGGPNGVSYESTSSKRMGPGGVMEEQHTVRDGRTGEQKMTITRGVGERQRTLERVRRDGQETRNERLQGIQSAEEAARFDQEWQQHAAAHLPADLSRVSRRSRRNAASSTPALGYGHRA